jgi:hypothetical protein
MRALLEQLEALPKEPKKTVSAWIEKKGDHLLHFAAWYGQLLKEEKKQSSSPKYPSEAERELGPLGNAFDTLAKRIDNLSPSAKGILLDAGLDLDPWDGSRVEELRMMGSQLANLIPPPAPESSKRRLIKVVATIVRRDLNGKRAHVLPIAQAIHKWAARPFDQHITADWGDGLLDEAWKRAGKV